MAETRQNHVGTPEGKPTDSGHQSAQQEQLTRTEPQGGKSDTERNGEWSTSGGEPGRPPVAIGGSSQGQSDRVSGTTGRKAVDSDGISQSERTYGGTTPPEADADDAAITLGQTKGPERDGKS